MPSETAANRLDALLDAIAAKQPTPGGGAVAAVCGALAAAIGEMVLNYSIGRKTSAAFDDELKSALAELNRARTMMLAFMAEDQAAFAALSEAKKLDKKTDPERSARTAAGVEACINVPLAIAATALSILRIADRAAERSNPWLLSDLAVCVELAMATIRAAHHSVRANFSEVDPTRRNDLTSQCDAQRDAGLAIVQRVIPLASGL